MYKCLVLALPGDKVRIEPIALGLDPKLSKGRSGTRPKKRSWNWRQKMLIFIVICVVFTREEFLNSFFFFCGYYLRVEKATKCHF